MTAVPSRDDPLSDFLAALHAHSGRAPRRSGQEWIASCPGPGHSRGDRNPSLSVAAGDRQPVVLHCHSGVCTPADICAAIGWDEAELCAPRDEHVDYKPVRKIATQRTRETEYIYTDENGNPEFRVVVTRFPDGTKKVRQQQALSGGAWAESLGRARRVLYKLPETIAAVAADETVYVVEGERCVEAMVTLGLHATTNPMGAGKWMPEYAEVLRGATVIVLPDNDDPGRSHAEEVAESLREVGASVRVFEIPGLPERGDIADWIADGGDRQSFEQLLAAIPETLPQDIPGAVVLPSPTAERELPCMRPEGYHGILKRIVDVYDGVSEASAEAIALQALVAVCTVIGRRPWMASGDGPQHANTNLLVVGETGIGAKGRAWSAVERLLEPAAAEFFEAGRMATGLSSGEGLVSMVRTAGPDEEPRPYQGQLLVLATEFIGVTAVAGRQGNTLGAILRNAWDGLSLQVGTKNEWNTLRARNPHISIIGHITPVELRYAFSELDLSNGVANRFMFAMVERRSRLPRPAKIDQEAAERITQDLEAIIQWGRNQDEITVDGAAEDYWYHHIYDLFDPGNRRYPEGRLRHLTVRSLAHISRLALMCALIDRSGVIRVDHMQAARAIWDYCEDSIRYLFEAQGADSKQQGEQAEKLLAAVQAAGPQGLRGRAQYAVFNNHISAGDLESIIETLHEQGRITVVSIPPRSTGGREQRILIAPEHVK